MPDPDTDIFQKSGLNLFSIPPGRPFLEDLSDHLLNRYSREPGLLADVTIYLPTRRSVRALTEVFLKQSIPTARALLLPRIRTIGDIDEMDMPNIGGFELDMPPPASRLERRLALANFVHKKNELLSRESGSASNWSTALRAADELATLLDAFYTEQVDFSELQTLVPEAYARHWQVTLEFLEIVTNAWPDYVGNRGMLDPSDYRRRLIDKLAASWDVEIGGTPPPGPVIVAGSTGSMPAVARLMRLVAGMPNGCTVLPGLDHSLDEPGWEEIEDPHPQAGLKKLLETYFDGVSPGEVKIWPAGKNGEGRRDRQLLVSLALRPAEATDDWLEHLRDIDNAANLKKAVTGLSIVEGASEAAETQAIAIALRSVLEETGKTAIFVTPDRTLARRVSLLLERWDIQLDDSAGVPFANTLRGNFLQLVANWLADPSEPVGLLALLKHPLCAAGFDRKSHSLRVQKIDLALRGLRPGKGFNKLKERLAAVREWDDLGRDEDKAIDGAEQRWRDVQPLVDRLEKIADAFLEEGKDGKSLLQVHLLCAERLASTDTQDGALRLWAYEDGETGAVLSADLLGQGVLLPFADHANYPDIFASLISAVPVRFRGRQHPRLKLLGPLEARLQHADVMILGGLNEGVWPDEARTDSFLSRPMREAMGLPSPEQRVGLSAHDFAQGACAREVLLTRSKRAGRSPSKPSRWLIRLKNILSAMDLLKTVDRTGQYQSWTEQLDAPEQVEPACPPGPCPPVEARPRDFSVTSIEKLMRDPYSIYASKILGLYKLDALNVDPGFAIRGRFYHHLYARFALAYPDKMPADPIQVLSGYAQELFQNAGVDSAVQAFWKARMHESFAWFASFHREALEYCKPVCVEQKGSWKFQEADHDFTLTARADRIDQCQDGMFIYDYKTGQIPTAKQNKTFSPQLQLTGLIAQSGGFRDLPAAPVAGYTFLKAVNRKKPDVPITGEEARELMAEAEENLRKLLGHYQNPVEPYLSQPRPFYQNDYGDYDHLARRDEWVVEGGGEES